MNMLSSDRYERINNVGIEMKKMDKDERLIHEVAHGKVIAEKGEAIWNWSSPAGKRRWARRSRMFVDFLANRNKRVLEIGCGTGLFTKEIAMTDNEITAIDISEDLIAIARNRSNTGNVTFLVENAYETQFENENFDVIVGSSSLHHLDMSRALSEIYRLLKYGGELMFTEPNMLNPQIALQKNIRFLKKLAGDSPDETAFFRWRISRMLKAAGFRNVVVVPFDFVHPGIPAVFVNALLPFLDFMERVPLLKEMAGSLIIKARK